MLQDAGIALRLLSRTPAATAVALLSIVFSVGAASVVFAAVRAVLLDPLPYPAVLGKTITVNGRPCLVIGVMPPGFVAALRGE